jgi:hypothetical protein
MAGSGAPLALATRARLEPRFNFDFGTVRVHDDSQAHRAAAALNARAFTVGDRIFFGAGQYAPASPEGQQLLAHELAHVTQQMGTATPLLGWPRNLGLEQQADDVASRVVRGGSLADAPRPAGAVGAVHFKLATGADTITAQQVLDTLAAGPVGAGPEAMAMLDRLLRLSDVALAQVFREVADRDPGEAPTSRPVVEGETALDALLRAAAGLSRGERLRLQAAVRAARQPRRAPVASPAVTSSPSPPPRHHEPGPRQRAREEQAFQQSLAAGTKDAAWNVAHRPSWPQIRRLVDAERGDIDLDFLLGWIDQESGGKRGTQHPGTAKDEVSLFQISREERADLGIDTAAMRQRLLTDLRTAVHEGLRFVRLEQQRLLSMSDVGLSVNSPAFWPFVRLMHEVGEPATKNWVRQMKTEFRSGNGVDPATATWDAIKEHARIHHRALFPLERLRVVDIMIARGAVIHRTLDAATP